MYPFCTRMKEKPVVLEDFELARLLTITRDAIRKARQKELNQFNVHIRRASLLRAIDSLGEKATPVAIAQWLLRERHTVSELLGKIEVEGLAKKIRDLDRKNRVRVVLTLKGTKMLEKSIVRTSLHQIISCLSEEDRERLRSLLKKLRARAMKEIGFALTITHLPDNDPDYQLFGLIIEATDAMHKARQKELFEHNINMSWSAILLTVKALGDRATPIAIGRWLLRERHTVSELLDKMEDDGLVMKIRDLDRKNRVRVVLTQKGIETYEKSQAGTAFPRVVSSLTKSEREHLKMCLRLLRNEALKNLGRFHSGKLNDSIQYYDAPK
jgi:MarR family transcriptional regulator, transcriptional regulator for hemolysin